MTRSPALTVRMLLAALAAILLTFAYPPFALSACGWFALTPLIIGLDGARVGAAAALGWLTGTILGLGVAGYWLWRAAVDYFGLAAPLAGAFTFGLIEVFVAPFFALFGVLVALGGARLPRLLFVPAAFVASEYLRATLVGNAWELLGHSQRALPVLQVVDLTGVYGLSFLLAMTSTALAEVVSARARGTSLRRPVRALAAAAVAIVIVWGYGAWRLAHLPATRGELRALLVQGDVSNAERSRPERVGAVLRRYLELSQSLQPVPPLVLWPENAVAVFPETNRAGLESVLAFVRGAATSLLTGAPRAGERAGTAAIYNSLYLFTADGIRSVYDKRQLLPFVERFTLRRADGPYLPGGEVAPINLAGARAGPLICYEVIYPDLARGLVASGADVLLNFSNDSWFDAGAGPAQHYELARLRAIENRVSLLRVTNSGVSGAFDPAGRELARLPTGVADAQAVSVPLRAGGAFYTRHGDWFGWLCLILVPTALLWRASRRRAM